MCHFTYSCDLILSEQPCTSRMVLEIFCLLKHSCSLKVPHVGLKFCATCRSVTV